MKNACELTFSHCSWPKEIGEVCISYKLHKVPPIIPMMMVSSHCLLQYIFCSHRESHLEPFALIDQFLFILFVNISLYMCFLKGIHTHNLMASKDGKVCSLCSLSPTSVKVSHISCLFSSASVCLDIRSRSTGYNTNLLLLLIRMFSQRTMYMTLPVSITWTVPQITSSKAFHGST